MRISTKGRYALKILLDIAQQGHGKPVSLRSVAQRQGMSEKYLEGIVSRLSAAQLVESVRGKYGGYRLVKAPKDYTVIEILKATEESMAIISSLESGLTSEEALQDITIGFWAGLQNYIHDYLTTVSLQAIMDGTYMRLDTKYDNWDGSI